MALTYRQLSDLHRTLAGAGATSLPLGDWATEMNALSGTDIYSAGQNDNWMKQASTGLDRLIERTGLPEAGGELGQAYGELFGAADTGRAVGEGLARGAVNFAPMLVPGAGWGMTAARLGLTGLLSGADTYTQTGSPAAGVISGGVAAAMPGVANLAEQAVLKGLGGRLVKGSVSNNPAFLAGLTENMGNVTAFNRLFPNSIAQGLASQAGGQVAAAGFGELGSMLQSGMDPNSEYEFDPASAFINMTLGQAPFAGIYLTKNGRAALGGDTTQKQASAIQNQIAITERGIELRTAKEALARKSGIEQVPESTKPRVSTPEIDAEVNATLGRLRTQQQAILNNPLLSPEDKVTQLEPLIQQDAEASARREGPERDNVLGSQPTDLTGRTPVFGKELKNDDRSRTILIADDEGNPPELRGKVINYSKGKYEQEPQALGEHTAFALPNGWFTVLPDRGVVAAKDNSQPDLPQQTAPPVELFHYEQALQESHDEVNAATTPAELQAAVVKLRAVQEVAGFPLTDDVRLAKRMAQLEKAGVKKDVQKKALLAEVTRAQRQQQNELNKLARHEQRMKDISVGNEFRAEQEGLAAADDAVADELNQLHALEETIGASRSKWADQLVGGELNRMYKDWADAGRKGGFEAFANHIVQVAKTGKDLLQTQDAVVTETIAKIDDSAEMAPINEDIVDFAVQQMDDPAAVAAFNAWPAKAEGYTFVNEKATFVAMLDAHALGNPDAMVEVFMDRDGMDEVEARDEARTYFMRPHVQEWMKGLNEKIKGNQKFLPSFVPMQERQEAGGGFVWGLEGYNAELNRLGKHTLPKNGKLLVSQFKNMGGRGKPLADTEIELAKVVVPEAFDGETVDVRALYKGLKEKGPVLEVKKLGGGEQKDPYTPEVRAKVDRRNQIQHELETLGYKVENDEVNGDDAVVLDEASGKVVVSKAEQEHPNYIKAPNEQVDKLVADFYRLSNETAATTLGLRSVDQRTVGGDARYSFLGPKSEQEMPGYVEGLVRVPAEQQKVYRDKETGELVQDHTYVDPKKNVKYVGPHFGSEDTNVLAFFRGYEEMVNGKKVFHVIEVQSDWGQQQRQRKQDTAELRRLGTVDEGSLAEDELDQTRTDHPLLRVYETLALKAAIKHAREIGAEAIVLSDGETAMMTEGHDKAGGAQIVAERGQNIPEHIIRSSTPEGYIVSKQDADAFGIKGTLQPLSQEGGMRLHYDQTLPSALSKLTGERGEGVELGVHKQAVDVGTNTDAIAELTQQAADGQITIQELQQRTAEIKQGKGGSPVFRNADGTPKSSITGRLYPLERAFSNLDAQSGFTVADPSRAPWRPTTAEENLIVQDVKPERGGHGLREFMERYGNAADKQLAKDLGKFAESLSRIKVVLDDTAGEGWARSNIARNAEIHLNPALFYGDKTRSVQVVGHELLHGLTLAEIDNPTNAKLVTELDALRERLAERLPKDLKARYDAAVASDWIGRYDLGSDMLKELGKTWDEQNLVYGLLNTKELVSQGFTSKPMQAFMKKNKAEGGSSYYHRFTDWVKKLFGMDPKNTAFDEFLSKTDALLQQGEWVSSFSNFTDRYFEGQGLSKELAKAQTQRALAIVLDSRHGTSQEMLLASVDVPSAVRSPELARAERKLNLMLQEKGDDYALMTSVMDEQGLASKQTGLDELAQEVMAGRVDSDVFEVLPDAASKYLFEKVSDMQQVLDGVRAASSTKNDGLVNLANPQFLREPLKHAIKATEKVLREEALQEQAVRDLQGLFAVSPDGYADKSFGDISAIPKFVADVVEDSADGVKGFGAWIKRGLQPIAQKVRENPESAEVYSRGWQQNTNARKFRSEGLKAFGKTDLNGPITKESVQQTADEISNPRVSSAVSKWMYENQKEGKKNGTTQILPEGHSAVQKILAGLTPKEQAGVKDAINKQSQSVQFTNAQQLEYMLKLSSTHGAIILNADNGLTTGQNVQVMGELLQSILDLNDPARAPLVPQRLSNIQRKIVDPQTFSDVLKFAEVEVGKYNLMKDFFAKNPAYASARREGKYLVHYMKNGKPKIGQAPSKAAGRQYVEERGGTLVRFENNWKDSEDSFPALGSDAEGLLQRYRELEESQIQILMSRGFTEEQAQKIRETSPAAQLATEAANRGGASTDLTLPRNLSKGAEDLPFLENHFSWVDRTANYWTRKLFSAQMDAHILETQFKDRPDLRKDFKTHKENYLHPDSQFAQKLTRFSSTWFMGFNLATAMVNMSQPFTTHVAELTSMTGKPLDSYRRVLNALGELAGEKLGKSGLNAEHEWLRKEATQDGELDLSMFDDDAAAQESVDTNYKRAIQMNKPKTLGQRLGTLSGNYSTAAFWLFRQGEKLNSQAALYASYDYYREQGMTKEQARDKAYEFNHAVNFGGGRAQRPVGAFSGRGAFPRSAAMLATSLQSYVLGTTFQLARYLNKGLFRPVGLTPAEVYSARKAAVQMLGTQLAAAGVLGLPFVSGAIALLDKSFPGLELNKNLREMMSSLFGEDEDDGNTLTDMAMTGVPSMLGWDLQSRLSMGNTVPGVSEINGFQPELVAGPAVNLITKFINGGKALVTGDMSGIKNNLLPTPVKSLIEAGRQQFADTPVEDYRNRPLFSPTPGEILGRAVGFQPKRLSDQNAASRILQASEENLTRREAQARQELASFVLKGEFGTVRQTLLARAQSEPQFDAVSAARGVARAAEELSFPRDLRREGSSGLASQRGKLLNAFGVSPQDVSELARLQFRLGVEQRLGVPPSNQRAQLQLAGMMDQLKVQNPSATRIELRRQAEALVRRSSARPTLGEPVE